MKQQSSHVCAVGDCQIDGVIVYQDRAEVTRSLIFHPHRIGEHEIILNSLSIYAVNFPRPFHLSLRTSHLSFFSLVRRILKVSV
jgi:hypothetical protein